MSDYISREAFVEQKRKQYCEECTRRKGFKRGQYKTLYEIGEAPCRACGIDDVLNDVEDFPASDVRPVVPGRWIINGWSIRCSECRYDMPFSVRNFCPNCGARMLPEPPEELTGTDMRGGIRRDDAGKKVDVKENSGIITISYTQSGCFTENMNKEADDGASAE